MKFSYYRIAEIAVGCCAAIALSMLLGLENSISAGIITILSIQDTKKETLRSAVERLSAFALAVLLSLFAFGVFGYHVWAFGVYLLLFAAITYRWNLQASLPICTVMVSHFWLAQHMQPWLILNEGILMLIGTGIGVGLNLFLPTDARAIREEQRRIEDILRAYFDDMADALETEADATDVQADLSLLREALRSAREKADTLQKNTLLGDAEYYVLYVEMRRHQYVILRRMADALQELEETPYQAKTLAGYMRNIAAAIHEHNDAAALLDELSQMRAYFRQSELPETRSAFETRALLYRLMIDTEHFLLIKSSFVESLTPQQAKQYLHAS